MSARSSELPIPDNVSNVKNPKELVRVWAGSGQQYVTINIDAWDDPAAWGIMLVDLARHIAKAYAKKNDITQDEALARLREGFEAEWSSPTE